MILSDKEKFELRLKNLNVAEKQFNIQQQYPNISTIVGKDAWFPDFGNAKNLENEYLSNPVLNAVINMKASFEANVKVFIRNIKNGEIITAEKYRRGLTKDKDVNKLLQLINNPNPLQSTKEFLLINSILKSVFGNAYIYGNSANGKIDFNNVYYLWNVWPQYMKPDLTERDYFSQVSGIGMVKRWVWNGLNNEKYFSTDEILHRKEPNIRLRSNVDLILGESKLVCLSYPLSNIKIAYESRNSIAQNMGMMGIISSNRNDGNMGAMMLDDEEQKEVQNDLSDYGTRFGQKKWLVTRHNIKYQSVDQDVRKLGLLNEIVSDAKIVCHEFNIPPLLLQMEQRGATFENQRVAERSAYQNTVIPESEDKFEDLNNWLQTREKGWEYVPDYSHLPSLQENEKDRSETIKNTSAVYERLFFAGGCTYNHWWQALGKEVINEPWANKRIVEMSDEEIQKIKGNYSISIQNEG